MLHGSPPLRGASAAVPYTQIMSRSPSTRAPTPLYPVDSGLGDLYTIHTSPRTGISSRSSVASSAVSSWTDPTSSKSPTPKPSEFAILLSPYVINHLQPLPLPLSNMGYAIHTPAFPSFAERGQYTSHLSSTACVSPSPSPSDLASGVSSPRTSESTHPHCSTVRRSERDERSARALDTVPCQICL